MAAYSGTPLLKKLGIKAGYQMWVGHEPPAYWDWISPLPEGVIAKSKLGAKPLDFIQLFVKEKKTFQREVLLCKRSLKPDGMIWISWPKKSSGVATGPGWECDSQFCLEKRTGRHKSLRS